MKTDKKGKKASFETTIIYLGLLFLSNNNLVWGEEKGYIFTNSENLELKGKGPRPEYISEEVPQNDPNINK